MSWLEELGQPLASTPEEATRYIQTELEAALPEGWELRRGNDGSLQWTIVRKNIPPGEWSIQEYGVRVTKALDLVVFTHGNKDVGPLSLHHVFLRSLTIDASALRHFGMVACLEYLMSQHEPNEWGYT